MSNYKKFAIIGGGSWGTAIATHTAKITDSVLLYARSKNIVEEINSQHTNSKYLGNILLPSSLTATNNLAQAIKQDIIFLAIPSIEFGNILQELSELEVLENKIFIIATKGIASNPVQLFSEKFVKYFKNQFAFFSGPNLAKEISSGKFATATISSKDIKLARNLALVLSNDNFEITFTDDIITTQVASIIKNIIAIKSGIMQANNAGENARAWLITKALKEIWYISKAMGGKQETILEPAVVGDLIVTSYSLESRNTKFGFELHRNNYSKKFINECQFLVEGIAAAKLIKSLIIKYGININDLPLINSIIEILEA